MRKTFFLLAALFALTTTTLALAQRGPGGGGPGGGGHGGPGGGGGQNNPTKIGGVVSALAATGASFTLTAPNGATATVNVTATTTIKNESNNSAATLANGEEVDVAGSFDKTGKIFTATAILVDDQIPEPHDYFGTVSNLAAGGASFTLTGPHKETATVNVSATTTITNYSDGSVATLANGQNVDVTGTIDSTGKIITATAIVVDDRKPPVHLSQAEGTILSLDATNETFILTVTKANFTPTGTTVHVVTTAKTAYCGSKGKLTFADLTAGAKVQVVGTFDAATQTLTATHISLIK